MHGLTVLLDRARFGSYFPFGFSSLNKDTLTK